MSEALFRAGVVLVPIACLAGAFLMTAGTDETWILFGARGLAEHGSYGAGSPFHSVQSTGGLHTVLAALLHRIGNGSLELIRILSVLSIAALLFALRQWARRFALEGPYRWLLTAAPLLVPGTLMFGAQAYGTVLAFLLVAVGLMRWGELEPESWSRRLWTGILVGAAAGTRLDCIFAVFAPLAAALLTQRKRAHLVDGGLVLLIGGCVFLVQAYLIGLLSLVGSAEGARAYGFGDPLQTTLGYLAPQRLSFWSISQSFMPFAVAILASVGWFRARERVARPQGADALLAFGWLVTLAWLTQGPIPHLRYLWPALAAFACVGVLALALLLQSAARSAAAVLAIGIALLATGYLDGARAFLHGESDILSWELSRETRYSLQYGPFRHREYQRAIVRRLLQIPPEQPVATIGFATTLSYLTRRTVVPVWAYYPGEGKEASVTWRPAAANPPVRPRWILAIPMVNRYPGAHVNRRLDDWIRANCRVAHTQGPYVLYEVLGPFPATADMFLPDSREPTLPLLETRL